MNQKDYSLIPLMIVLLISFFGTAVILRSNFSTTPSAVLNLNPNSTPIQMPTPISTTKPSIVPVTSDKWVWENLGCGSSAPCSYRVCSGINPNSCYWCQGFYDKSSPEGEKLPTSNENPQTTTNFKCTKID